MTDTEALFLGYLVLWLGVLGYTIYLHIMNRKLKNDIDLLRRGLDRY